MKAKNTLPRPFTVADIYRKKMNVLNFEGEFLHAFGKPEVRGSWIFIGEAFQGKTSFAMQLAKYLTNFGRVLYNSIEEGVSKSIRDVLQREEMETVKSRFHFLDQEPMETLTKRLELRRSADFIFIDSAQYTFIDKAWYKAMLHRFPQKLFIFISHAKGKEPKGSLAEAIWYDAFIKGRIQGYRCFVESRYNGIAHYDIWPEKAAEYWAEPVTSNT